MDTKEVFKSYLDKTEVLIVDKNPSSRNRLLKTMIDLGGKKQALHTCGSLDEALQIMNTKKIGIVLSDYYIMGGSGFDLFRSIREKDPENKELCLILVTANISQTAVAKAAEEEVDSFVIKPYTIQSIQENLISTIAAKIKPSDYSIKIEEGKKLLKDKKYDKAIDCLQNACMLHAKPALALFYIAQAEFMKQNIEDAEVNYTQGLEFISIHFKCLIGLYEMLIQENKLPEAYQVITKVAKYFPANPDRLTQIVRLAIQTGNFQDMQMYYEIFVSLEERVPALTNYIGAGMYVSGKYHLLKNNYERAIQYFDNIAVSCSEFTKFIRAIITVLVEHDRVESAEKYITRFSSESKMHEDYLISEFLIASRKLRDPGAVVKQGLALYNKKIRDYHCLQAMILAMKNCGYGPEKLAPYEVELDDMFASKMVS